MKITRYPLERTDYQQIQPLWPGRVLSVGAVLYDDHGYELTHDQKHIAMWCLDDDDARTGPPPILGVWMLHDGEPFPPEMSTTPAQNVLFHGTIDPYPPRMATLHVWSAVIGYYEPKIDAPLGEVSSIDDIAAKIRERHADRNRP